MDFDTIPFNHKWLFSYIGQYNVGKDNETWEFMKPPEISIAFVMKRKYQVVLF